jgi:hypothetical protein
MQYTFSHRGDEPETTIKTVFGKYDELPEWDDLGGDDQDLLLDALVQDDFLGRLIVMREAAYSHSNEVDEDLGGAEVIEREMFRSAEWLRETGHIYVAERTAQLLGLGSYEEGDAVAEDNGGGQHA